MNEFISNLSSLYWWISIVIVGILLNLISSYLKNSLDSRLSRLSLWWRNKSEAQKAKRQREIERLRSEPKEQILKGYESLRSIINGLYFLLSGMLMFVLVGTALTATKIDSIQSSKTLSFHTVFAVLFLMLGSLSFLIGYKKERDALYLHSVLLESLKDETSEDEA